MPFYKFYYIDILFSPRFNVLKGVLNILFFVCLSKVLPKDLDSEFTAHRREVTISG